ncbi:MAG: glycosyltransferase family 2 protein [Clostridiales bacterium]|jgi:glycosyltransferase involved in cell wall biosynthesis|nr:glycosyltransferase family 2 protein [Clostridiales bacterium]
MRIDVVVPCFNERECVSLFYGELKKTLEAKGGCDFRVIYVDDGSRDDTLSEVKALKKQDPARVEYISFARNFGKEAAIYAGLRASRAELTAIMDADLQDPPALLLEMLEGIEEGYDCCVARRADRAGEPVVRSFFSDMYYRIMNRFSSVKLRPGVRDFRLMTRRVLEAALLLEERERFSKGMLAWVGFKTKYIDYKNAPRAGGRTKWSFWGLFKYAVGGITAFSTAPLRFAVLLGLLTIGASFAYMAYVVIITLAHGRETPGFATIISMLIFLCGVIIFLQGITGEYLARMYTEIKKRPIYITKEDSFGNDDESAESKT